MIPVWARGRGAWARGLDFADRFIPWFIAGDGQARVGASAKGALVGNTRWQGDGPRPKASRRSPRPGPTKTPVVPLDAEDIALARLQAHLRKAETIRGSARRGGTAMGQTTVRLPRQMIQAVRERARRAGLTISEVVRVALAGYLKSS